MVNHYVVMKKCVILFDLGCFTKQNVFTELTILVSWSSNCWIGYCHVISRQEGNTHLCFICTHGHTHVAILAPAMISHKEQNVQVHDILLHQGYRTWTQMADRLWLCQTPAPEPLWSDALLPLADGSVDWQDIRRAALCLLKSYSADSYCKVYVSLTGSNHIS